MSILDLELRARYQTKEEAAKARGITVKQVERLLEIGRLLPVCLPGLDERGHTPLPKGARAPRRR